MFPNTHDVLPLPARPDLQHYKKLAKDLVKVAADPAKVRQWAGERGDAYADAIAAFILKRASKGRFVLADAQYVIARIHGFASWPKFAKHIEEPLSDFERAVDAIVDGDLAALKRLLKKNPPLVRQRSPREHRSTLLHYVSANGVENYRQRTPKNIAEIAKVLLDAGAEVDAEADMYGGGATALGLAATSVHPEVAGVQDALMQTLLDRGAAIGDRKAVVSCLENGRGKAAEFLAAHGAELDLEGAAGVGRLDIVTRLLPSATGKQLNDAFAWACQFGRIEVVEFLLSHGIDINARLRHNGQTGLHWAAWGAHTDVVKLLLARGARVDIKDETYEGRPLDWALYARKNRTDMPDPAAYDEVIELLGGATPPAPLPPRPRGRPARRRR